MIAPIEPTPADPNGDEECVALIAVAAFAVGLALWVVVTFT